MKVGLEEARDMFVALGFKTANKWDAGKVTKKVASIKEVVNDGVPDTVGGDHRKLLDKLVEAAEEEREVTIVESNGEAKAEDKPAKGKGKEKVEKAAPKKEEDAAKEAEAKKAEEAKAAAKAKEDEKAAAKKAKDDAKAAKQKEREEAAKAKAEARKNAPAGVRAGGKTMPYICGQVIKKHGIKAGVTEEMVKEADKMAGRDNPNQTWFNLRNAWHAIVAYTGADEKDED